MKFLLTSIGNLPSYKRIKYSLPGSKDKSWTGKLAALAVTKIVVMLVCAYYVGWYLSMGWFT